jgi:alpha-mannosidase
MNRPYHATLVSHTHWDRAWYVTFQEYRIRLVRLVDRLLDLLQTRADYRVYMLDGQMAVLEDYLEVRPQRAAELQAFCRQGRIQVGPWYVLADEFLVSPEALPRSATCRTASATSHNCPSSCAASASTTPSFGAASAQRVSDWARSSSGARPMARP